MLKKNILNWKFAGIMLMAIVLGYVSLPSQYQFLPIQSQTLDEMEVVLGLDLQGGTQLDYSIDLRNVDESRHNEILDGVEEVITRRVNKLGVSEPNIYNSEIAGERHIIVELAGIDDIEEAKNRVGKTIQLEFKEQKAESDADEKGAIRDQAQAFLNSVQAEGADFAALAEAEAKAFPNKVTFIENDFQFKDQISGDILPDKIFNAAPGTIISEVIEDNAGFVFQNNQLQQQDGFFVIQVLESQEAEKDVSEPREVKAQHILLTYEGSSVEGATGTREQAETRAKELIEELNNGANFDTLAKENSAEPGAATSAGLLDAPVVEGDSSYVAEFTDAALALSEVGEYTTQPVLTEFGYHIIKAVEVKAAVEQTTTENQVKYNQAFFSTVPDPWQDTELTGEYFVSASVEFDQLLQPQVAIQFDSTGAQLFAEITERNVGQPVAIFVGGELISSPNVNAKITGGQAVITGNFSLDEAQALARDLNTGAIPAPITLVGQYNIGSTLGQAALEKSLYAGLVGLVLLSLYLIAYYRAPGVLAVIALAIYAIFLLFVIKASLPVVPSIGIGIVIGFSAINAILKNKESTSEKLVSILISLFALFFFTFLLREPIVLTLAGIAGVILSVGMAVDANILIFERIREEIRGGREIKGAIEVGFQRAWSSIRDSNFSSLITCAILFYFGSSIIRGFALNLAAGILISMFTAITITRTFLLLYARWKGADSKLMLGVSAKDKPRKHFNIIGRSKVWFAASSLLLLISLGSLFTQGLNPGIDFKGGTLMEVQFTEEVTKAELENHLTELASTIDTEAAPTESEEATTDDVKTEEGSSEPEIVAATSNETIEIGKPNVVESVNEAGTTSYIIRIGFIDNPTHEEILASMETEFGELTETRFTTIGPVIGKTLQRKAVIALGFALIMIVLYIGFAFRNVPKAIGAWKFGACAIAALVHDVILILGFFSILQIEIDSLFITALLTIIGFSVHDTIVVFDRLRENLKAYDASKDDFDETANAALNQTMARSINTSLSTLFTLLALVILGAQSIYHFSLALTLGIIFGTYSSIFVASPILAAWKKRSS